MPGNRDGCSRANTSVPGANRGMTWRRTDSGFVMVKSDEASTLQQLTVVQNWFEELTRRAAPGK